jgi:hypothetical protein
MVERIQSFVGALRAAGMRVSLAEGLDALYAVELVGTADREQFRATLQAALLKDSRDLATFRRLFDVYFSSGVQPLPALESLELDPADQALIEQLLQEMRLTMSPQLAALFEMAVGGGDIGDRLGAMLAELPPPSMHSPFYQEWMARRVLRELGYAQLEQAINAMIERLRTTGMDEASLALLAEAAQRNRQALAEQVARMVAAQMMEAAALEPPTDPQHEELLDRPFTVLSHAEIQDMRQEVMRMAVKLRSRSSLRRQSSRRGAIDVRKTIRANVRHGGVPLQLEYRRHKLAPRLLLICDLSGSMRAVASFMLTLVYALQDQVSRTRSFGFIDDLLDISAEFVDARPGEAIERVLRRMPADYARTDLGQALTTFTRDYLDTVDRRTSVLILGDGRNNYADPNLPALKQIAERSRRLIWFNPESQRAWGTGDSDMRRYAELCDEVYQVRTLRQLSDAVEQLMR